MRQMLCGMVNAPCASLAAFYGSGAIRRAGVEPSRTFIMPGHVPGILFLPPKKIAGSSPAMMTLSEHSHRLSYAIVFHAA